MSDIALRVEGLDAIRKCMLRGNISLELDSLAAAPPVNRCILVAKALHSACTQSADMREIVEESNVMESLKNEAILRKGSESLLKELAPLYIAQPASQKTERARGI